jgi:hypothetical protein
MFVGSRFVLAVRLQNERIAEPDFRGILEHFSSEVDIHGHHARPPFELWKITAVA